MLFYLKPLTSLSSTDGIISTLHMKAGVDMIQRYTLRGSDGPGLQAGPPTEDHLRVAVGSVSSK